MANGGGKLEGTVDLAQHVTRPLVTVLLVAVLCAGFLLDKITSEAFTNVVFTVVGFWFAQRGQDKRSEDGATATAPPGGGTATASVTPAHPEGGKP